MQSFSLSARIASLVTTYQTTDSRLIGWRQDINAGAIASIVTLPVCIASGVLAFAPLGPSYAAMGAAAGLCGAIVAGSVSALVATSSFIMTSPRVSESLLLASLIAVLSGKSAVANDKSLLVNAIFLCVALGGIATKFHRSACAQQGMYPSCAIPAPDGWFCSWKVFCSLGMRTIYRHR